MNFSFLRSPHILLLCLWTGHDYGALTDLGISNHTAIGSNSSCNVWIILCAHCWAAPSQSGLAWWLMPVASCSPFTPATTSSLGSALSYQFSCHCVQIVLKRLVDEIHKIQSIPKKARTSKLFSSLFSVQHLLRWTPFIIGLSLYSFP